MATSPLHDGDTHVIKRILSPWNPLDQMRLLGWLFLAPSRLETYRKEMGEAAVHRVGAWLASTLLWLPFGLLLARNMEWRLGWLMGVMIVGWGLTGWLGRHEKELSVLGLVVRSMVSIAVLVVAGYCTHSVIASHIPIAVADCIWVTSMLPAAALGTTYMMAYLIAVAFPSVLARLLASRSAYQTTLFSGLGVALAGICEAGIDIFGFVTWGPVGIGRAGDSWAWRMIVVLALDMMLVAPIITMVFAQGIWSKVAHTNAAKTLRACALVLLLISYVMLIWMCLLGGYQMLLQNC